VGLLLQLLQRLLQHLVSVASRMQVGRALAGAAAHAVAVRAWLRWLFALQASS
jgi:hypothetical protein